MEAGVIHPEIDIHLENIEEFNGQQRAVFKVSHSSLADSKKCLDLRQALAIFGRYVEMDNLLGVDADLKHHLTIEIKSLGDNERTCELALEELQRLLDRTGLAANISFASMHVDILGRLQSYAPTLKQSPKQPSGKPALSSIERVWNACTLAGISLRAKKRDSLLPLPLSLHLTPRLEVRLVDSSGTDKDEQLGLFGPDILVGKRMPSSVDRLSVAGLDIYLNSIRTGKKPGSLSKTSSMLGEYRKIVRSQGKEIMASAYGNKLLEWFTDWPSVQDQIRYFYRAGVRRTYVDQNPVDLAKELLAYQELLESKRLKRSDELALAT